jgi:CubicO group peptidase (beta-lactamase class C family)
MSYGTDSLVRDLYAAEELGPRAGFGWYFADKREPICASAERLGKLPFIAQPGERWVYGYNTDVLGCVIERAAHMSFADFVRTRITAPLGMADTRFCLPGAQRERLTVVYALTAQGLSRAREGALGQGDYVEAPCVSQSGGAGLLSTAQDYARFLTMMANGGALGSERLLSPTTVALMTRDHVGALYGVPGMGFGLGFEVLLDPGRAGRMGEPGQFGWGGAYHTVYWVDPNADLVAVFMTQLLPATGSLLQDRFRVLVYQALVAGRR